MFLKSYSHYSSFLWGSPSLMEPHLSQQHVPRPQICCLSTITGGIQVRVYLYHHRYLRNYYWRVKVTYYLLVLWLIKRLPAYNTYLPTTTHTYLLQHVPTFYNPYLPSTTRTYLLQHVPTTYFRVKIFCRYLPIFRSWSTQNVVYHQRCEDRWCWCCCFVWQMIINTTSDQIIFQIFAPSTTVRGTDCWANR